MIYSRLMHCGLLSCAADSDLVPAGAVDSAQWASLAATLAGAHCGLLVVGELLSSAEAAAAVRLASLLGWPVAADVLSGLHRVETPPPHKQKTDRRPVLVLSCMLAG